MILFLIILLVGSRLLPLQFEKAAVLTNILLQKVLIVDEILGLYEIHVTQINFLGNLRNLLVLMNFPNIKLRIGSILKYSSDVSKVIRIKVFVNIKVLSIYQYFST